MFNKDFFPTPLDVIERMLEGVSLPGKTVLEPSAGKGDIVDFCAGAGANLLACEINSDLRKIVERKCRVIESDFLKVTAEAISHVDLIVMNPPFSADETHILHAYEIAPAGCHIIALCNKQTIVYDRFRNRQRLSKLLEQQGAWEDLGDCFSSAERKTGVEVALIRLQKPGASYESEFEGFFTEEDEEAQATGIMAYNFVRDLVNRYIGAIKIFDEQLAAAIRMNELTGQFFSGKVALSVTAEGAPLLRNEYKKDLQKSAWKWVFQQMNMQKYVTAGVLRDINKFVEQQEQYPFTMRNIYRMLEVIAGTHNTRMDKAVLEVFEKLTYHHHDNRHGLEGWKTNSHYLLGKMFIAPYIATPKYSSGWEITYHSDRYEVINDLVKAICYLTGKRWEDYGDIWHINQRKEKVLNKEGKLVEGDALEHREFGKWYDWAFFQIRVYKKGTVHFKFVDMDAWAAFNRKVSELKGFPLYEAKEQTVYQQRNTGRKQAA